MKLYFLIAVDVDRAAILADNPPENLSEAVRDEVTSALEDTSVRQALGVTGVRVTALSEPVADYALRCALWDENPRV